jgi:hypothetical protein
MNIKGLFGAGLLALALPVLAEETIMDFEMDEQHWEEYGVDWRYARAEDQDCAYLDGQAKLCNGTHRLFMLYNAANNDHIGWMRYGYFVPTESMSITGSALQLTYTGGVTEDDDGELVTLGEPVFGYYEFQDAYANLGDAVYANDGLPGTPTLYYKDQNAGIPTLGLFEDTNRFSVHTWMPREENPYFQRTRYNADLNRPTRTLAWYPFIDTAKASHYYHQATNRSFGGWIKVNYDAHPTHSNAGISNPNGSLPEGGYDAPYDGTDYFDRVAGFAIRFLGMSDSESPYSLLTDEWTKSYVPYENEETISSLAVGYDPVTGNFDLSFEDKYRCLTCASKYEVRYSFSPINTGNFDLANELEDVKNYFEDDDNDANEIIKANQGYNQSWAYLVLPYNDAVRFKEGERLYFAVRDISERTFDYDLKDDEIVSTPWGNYRKRDLIKSIYVDYHETALALDKNNAPIDFVPVGEQVGVKIETTVLGGISFLGNPPVISSTPFIKSSWSFFPTPSTDEVDYCGKSRECNSYTLADVTSGEVFFSSFSSLSSEETDMAMEDVNGVTVGNFISQTQIALSGEGVQVGEADTISFVLKNTNATSVTVTPRATSYIHGRPSLYGEERYFQETRIIYPGQEVEWITPAQKFSGEMLSGIIISIPNNIGLELTSIALNTESEMVCLSCGEVLVDYFVDGSTSHEFGFDSWTSVAHGSYTKQIGDGFGIVVGSNAGYDSVSITGNEALVEGDANARVLWENVGDTPYTFTPKYTLEQIGQPSVTGNDIWIESNTITLEPGASAEQIVPINEGTRIININVGVNNPGDLILDKILLSSE